MSRPKVVLTARLNTKGFPFVDVKLGRNAIERPVEIDGKIYSGESIQGFYARYPHTVGNCLFPGCKGGVARHVQPLGRNHVDAYAQFQRIERDFTRMREGKLPIDDVKTASQGRSIVPGPNGSLPAPRNVCQ